MVGETRHRESTRVQAGEDWRVPLPKTEDSAAFLNRLNKQGVVNTPRFAISSIETAIRRSKRTLEEIVLQIHNRTEPDVPTPGRVSELEGQILRLQCLVSHLIERNEELRQQIAARFNEERSFSLSRTDTPPSI